MKTIAELKKDLSAAQCVAIYGVGNAKDDAKNDARKLKARIARRERDQSMRDLGLVKARGSLGGTYWE